jgi:hypothetical protein
MTILLPVLSGIQVPTQNRKQAVEQGCSNPGGPIPRTSPMGVTMRAVFVSPREFGFGVRR